MAGFKKLSRQSVFQQVNSVKGKRNSTCHVAPDGESRPCGQRLGRGRLVFPPGMPVDTKFLFQEAFKQPEDNHSSEIHRQY